MLKLIFKIIAIVGMILIGILVFYVPDNPWKIIPSVSEFLFDRPLWLNLIVTFGFFYIIFLMMIYDKLEQRK